MSTNNGTFFLTATITSHGT